MAGQRRDEAGRERFANRMSRLVPDAVTAGVILTLVMVAVGLSLGNSVLQEMDAYHRGLWMLLPFTMQMTLIIVLSMSLGATPFFRKAIAALARVPRSRNQVVVLAFLSSGLVAYVYWGLGYALGPIIAIHSAAEAERRGLAVDFPFLLAVTSAGQALWQYGLSTSAPLLVATPGHFLQDSIGIVPLSTTIWSPAAMIHEAAFACAAMVAGCRLMPKKARPISGFPESQALVKVVEPVLDEDRSGGWRNG